MDNAIASRKRRIIAVLIDFWLVGYFTSLSIYSVFFVVKTPWDTEFIQGLISLHSAMGLTGLFVFLCKDSFKGLSFGKLLMGIRVVKTSGGTIRFPTALLRNLSLLVWPIEALAIVINSKKRRLGDYLAGTKVKRDLKISGSHRGLATLFIICFYWFTPSLPSIDFTGQDFNDISQYIVKHSKAYEVAEQAILNQPEIEKLIGSINDISVGNTSNIATHNDEGQAHLVLVVIGEHGELPVEVKLIRAEGNWQLIEMEFEHIENIEQLNNAPLPVQAPSLDK